MQKSATHSYVSPRKVGAFMQDTATIEKIMNEDYRSFSKVGLSFDESDIKKLIAAEGFDAIQGPVLSGTVPVPLQYLQSWMPGFVRVAMQPRLIDELIGVQTVGKFEDEEVVQGVLELVGKAVPYSDATNVPLSSWANSYERRSIVRFEEGFMVGFLEDKRAAAGNINSAAEKRAAAVQALDIARNSVGFLGFNGGNNRTYGFLNDPGLPAYVTVAATGTGATTTWSTKDFLAITGDLRDAFKALRSQSKGLIDPKTTKLTLAVALDCVDYLTVTSSLGFSVNQWLKENYPQVRVVAVPELNAANGGANVFYLYADSLSDTSTDGGGVFTQIVPNRFMLIGTEQRAKGMLEDYGNALGGVMVKRPYLIIRRSGI